MFGAVFVPDGALASNSSVGLLAVLNDLPEVDSVRVFCPAFEGTRGGGWAKIAFEPCWSPDRPLSLIRAWIHLVRRARRLDGFVFNTYVTAYGRDPVSNGLGLLLPVALRRLTRRPVVVYMHNFVETQDVAGLGYRLPAFLAGAARLLERALVRSTTVLVPLESQRAVVEAQVAGPIRAVFLPFLEAVGLRSDMAPEGPPDRTVPAGPLRVLMLGSWGPQKDLSGALRALADARANGADLVATVTGVVNRNFPAYAHELKERVRELGADWVRLTNVVDDRDLLSLVRGHDLLLLPYHATGGYSGAMVLGAYGRLRIVAYDLPQLRETAELLGVRPIFVAEPHVERLSSVIVEAARTAADWRPMAVQNGTTKEDERARQAVRRLIELLRKPDGGSVS